VAYVRFTRHLHRYFPTLVDHEAPAVTVAELIARVNLRHPGLSAYIVDERGAVRKHVNIYVDGELVRDRTRLSDPLADGSVVDVIQALSGG
jgi:sulfur carrier protein ThiS